MERNNVDRRLLLRAAGGNPGDIVGENYYEASRDILVTAKLIRQGSVYREKLIQKLKTQRDVDLKQLDDLLAKRDSLGAQYSAKIRAVMEERILFSPLASELEEIARFCTENNVVLVVLALPIDVQVSQEEWKKYNIEPVDMSASLSLNHDLIQEAHRF